MARVGVSDAAVDGCQALGVAFNLLDDGCFKL